MSPAYGPPAGGRIVSAIVSAFRADSQTLVPHLGVSTARHAVRFEQRLGFGTPDGAGQARTQGR